ncbi:hypothetical protein [uncultured Aquimarina sp.]|uniref:hypothetical protein n=1 Tax=uncultured Aquimarina sp. TaxID=575652 RepID=UPI002623A09D|nr:hypothetical protein [uncultured Aquimarina sp.]
MIFQRDSFFLSARFGLISLGTFLAVSFGKLFLSGGVLISFSNDVKLISVGTIVLINLFMVHTIKLEDKTLLMKSIFGITIKRIKSKEIKGRKVKYTHKPSNIPNILFSKKFDRNCQVKFSLTQDSYSFNGHILSNKGLQQLLTKTKK